MLVMLECCYIYNVNGKFEIISFELKSGSKPVLVVNFNKHLILVNFDFLFICCYYLRCNIR